MREGEADIWRGRAAEAKRKRKNEEEEAHDKTDGMCLIVTNVTWICCCGSIFNFVLMGN